MDGFSLSAMDWGDVDIQFDSNMLSPAQSKNALVHMFTPSPIGKHIRRRLSLSESTPTPSAKVQATPPHKIGFGHGHGSPAPEVSPCVGAKEGVPRGPLGRLQRNLGLGAFGDNMLMQNGFLSPGDTTKHGHCEDSTPVNHLRNPSRPALANRSLNMAEGGPNENIGVLRKMNSDPTPDHGDMVDSMGPGALKCNLNLDDDSDMDVPAGHDRGDRSPFILPTTGGRGTCHYLDPATMAAVLSGHHNHLYESIHIFDARFPYEFEGGHIRGAMNFCEEKDAVAYVDSLRRARRAQMATSRPLRPALIIVHCEFSQKRGPSLYKTLRTQDRLMHVADYPNLEFPELYVLKGGYSAFFAEFMEYCEPQNYVRMWDSNHKAELTQHVGKWRRSKSWSATTRTQPQPATSRGLPKFGAPQAQGFSHAMTATNGGSQSTLYESEGDVEMGGC